nr:PREDICTED: endoplasmic reticulum resident protein 27 [Opisthocomus hoazin]
MGTSVFPCLFVLLLAGGSPAACAGDSGSASRSTASTAEKPILLNNITDAEAFISGVEVAVIGFFQPFNSLQYAARQAPRVMSMDSLTGNSICVTRIVDNDRRDLDMNSEDVDAKKMIRFIRMNELRLVTEYNPVTAVGVMQSSLQFNLLLITDKMSPKHPERMRKYRAAAELFKGKILFILVDSNLKSNERTVSFFKLKKSQLPALAIFHTPDEEQDVLTLDEVSVERVQDFCNRFLQRMKKKEDESEEKALNEEL